jgi:hypothetical protein
MNASGVRNLILAEVCAPYPHCKLLQNVSGGKFNKKS